MRTATPEGGRSGQAQAGRACSQDNVDAPLSSPPPGSTADLLADPGLDGRLRRQWLAQKVAHWRQHPPHGFVNPRPVPAGGPRWTPPSLVCDRTELEPAEDVAELVARQRGRLAGAATGGGVWPGSS